MMAERKPWIEAAKKFLELTLVGVGTGLLSGSLPEILAKKKRHDAALGEKLFAETGWTMAEFRAHESSPEESLEYHRLMSGLTPGGHPVVYYTDEERDELVRRGYTDIVCGYDIPGGGTGRKGN